MSSLNYFSNFDDSKFRKMSLKNNEFNNLKDDNCYINQQNNDNNKKLKFITTNHIDLLENKEKLNFFGYSIKDQLFVPGDKIDTYSNLLNGQNGEQLTNCKIKNNFGQLPLISNYRGQLFHGDIDKEDYLQKTSDQVKKNACLPRDSNYQKRSFYIFNDKQGIETPAAINSVESQHNGFSLGRNGANTRFDKRFFK
jgi:hypothetical protein